MYYRLRVIAVRLQQVNSYLERFHYDKLFTIDPNRITSSESMKAKKKHPTNDNIDVDNNGKHYIK